MFFDIIALHHNHVSYSSEQVPMQAMSCVSHVLRESVAVGPMNLWNDKKPTM